ncbi:MAG: WD40 repeat domain-containing protein, partial [Chthoniobacterales bacterium]|nr:WD40 repeat domain-containing protein [Chthoniobacterales bacterium]
MGLAWLTGMALAVDVPAQPNTSIPWDQIGAKAGADYTGDGLAVTPTESGALLRCVFQRMDGEATHEGLWLMSTVTDQTLDRFQVKAAEVGWISEGQTFNTPLESSGTVSVDGQTVRFTRPGLVEEYSVSMDGVRQDFVVLERPAINHPLSTLNPASDELRVELTVTGARVEPTAQGAQLVLAHSGRKIAYSRLRVTDAMGRELPARFDVAVARQNASGVEQENGGGVSPRPCAELAVVVNDADAVYPVRIDPTFSDANWISMGGLPGADNQVNAAVVDGSGNLYIGGAFTLVGDAVANGIAKWDGTRWSALGSGMDGGDDPSVKALAVSGGDVYAGGGFTTAGGIEVHGIAKWNGSTWSALGSGMEGEVYALAVSGGEVYAGGAFTTAGGIEANRIAKWDGSSWSALGSGISGDVAGHGPSVDALAVLGGEVYAGGLFMTAGGIEAKSIAKWNGSSWSALGSGLSGHTFNSVRALAVSGSDVYVGGVFTAAGGIAANYVAKWNGSSWSALGSGAEYEVYALAVSGDDVYAGGWGGIEKWDGSNWSALGSGINGDHPTVNALAVSGGDVYAGGWFTTAGGIAAIHIAKWSGSSWNALGSGMNAGVRALAVSGGDVYAGGWFTTADGANRVAKWNGSSWSALGSGMNGGVNALAVSDGDVYAGGWFTTAGGIEANRVAKWNGSSWSALGSGMNGVVVSALAVSGGDVYAGGWFITEGEIEANNIAKWNGSSWSALGSGMNGGVNALV